jgi:hypothetical protein
VRFFGCYLEEELSASTTKTGSSTLRERNSLGGHLPIEAVDLREQRE